MKYIMNVWKFFDGKKLYLVGVAMMIVGIYQKNTDLFLQGCAMIGIKSALVKLE